MPERMRLTAKVLSADYLTTTALVMLRVRSAAARIKRRTRRHGGMVRESSCIATPVSWAKTPIEAGIPLIPSAIWRTTGSKRIAQALPLVDHPSSTPRRIGIDTAGAAAYDDLTPCRGEAQRGCC